MIIWLNGAFGAGKTTAATALVAREPGLRRFDPEDLGSALAKNLSDEDFTDFQQLPPWRSLTPLVAHEIAQLTGQIPVAVQTVLVEDYWNEIADGFARLGETVVHVLLDAEPSVLIQRIHADDVEAGASDWRLQHVAAYRGARQWMTQRADLVLDTTELTPDAVVAELRTNLAGRWC